MKRLKKFAKAASQRNLSPADTDLIEVTLTTLLGLDKLIHLLRSRSDFLELTGLRLTWEEKRLGAWDERQSIQEELGDFIRKMGRWTPEAYKQVMESLVSASSSSVNVSQIQNESPLASPVTASTPGRRNSAFSTTSRNSRYKVAEDLTREAGRFSTRIAAWKRNFITPAGNALDRIIEKKPVPDPVLDEQDRLENNVRPLETLGRFGMEVVAQWKKADELYGDLKKELDAATSLRDEIRYALGHHPNGEMDASFSTRSQALTQRLTTLTSSMNPRLFPKPTHPFFPDQPACNESILSFLSSELSKTKKVVEETSSAAREYHTRNGLINKAENARHQLEQLKSKLHGHTLRLTNGVVAEDGDGSPIRLDSVDCLDPLKHGAYLAILPITCSELQEFESAGNLQAKICRQSMKSLAGPAVDPEFAQIIDKTLEEFDTARKRALEVKEESLSHAASLRDVRKVWLTIGDTWKRLDAIKIELIDRMERSKWTPIGQEQPVRSPMLDHTPSWPEHPYDTTSPLKSLSRDIPVSITGAINSLKSTGPEVMRALNSGATYIQQYLENVGGMSRLYEVVRKQASVMSDIRSEHTSLEDRVDSIIPRFEKLRKEVISSSREPRDVQTHSQDAENLSQEYGALKEALSQFSEGLSSRVVFIGKPDSYLQGPLRFSQPSFTTFLQSKGSNLSTTTMGFHLSFDTNALDHNVRTDANNLSMRIATRAQELSRCNDILDISLAAGRVKETLASLQAETTELLNASQKCLDSISEVQVPEDIDDIKLHSDALSALEATLQEIETLSRKSKQLTTQALPAFRDSLRDLFGRPCSQDPIAQEEILKPCAEKEKDLTSSLDLLSKSLVSASASTSSAVQREKDIIHQLERVEVEKREKLEREQREREEQARLRQLEEDRLKEEEEERVRLELEAERRRQREEAEELAKKAEEEAERQRLLEEARLQAQREEEARIAEELRLAKEAEAQRLREEEERIRAAEEARLQEEAEQKRREEEEAERVNRLAEEEARLLAIRQEEERLKALAKTLEDEKRRLREDQEQSRLREEAEKRQREEDELRRQQEAEQRRVAEEEELKRREEAERRRVMEEQESRRQIAEEMRRLEEERLRLHEEEQKLQLAEEQRQRDLEEERIRKLAEEDEIARRRAEEHRIHEEELRRLQRLAEEERIRIEEEKMNHLVGSPLVTLSEAAVEDDIFSIPSQALLVASPSDNLPSYDFDGMLRRLRALSLHRWVQPMAKSGSSQTLPDSAFLSRCESVFAEIRHSLENINRMDLDDHDRARFDDVVQELEVSDPLFQRCNYLASISSKITECDASLSDLLEHVDGYPSAPIAELQSPHISDPTKPPEEQLTARLSYTEDLLKVLDIMMESSEPDDRVISERDRLEQTWSELREMGMDRLNNKSRPSTASGRDDQSGRTSSLSAKSGSSVQSIGSLSLKRRVERTPMAKKDRRGLGLGPSPRPSMVSPMATPKASNSRNASATVTVREDKSGASKVSKRRSISGPINPNSSLHRSTFSSRQRTTSVSPADAFPSTPTRLSSAPRSPFKTPKGLRPPSPNMSETSSVYSKPRSVSSRINGPSFGKPPPRPTPSKPLVRKPYVANPKNRLDVAVGNVVNKMAVSVPIQAVQSSSWEDKSGKYWIGDDEEAKLCFCRILRSQTVMVRVGGGWCELSKFLRDHFAHLLDQIPEAPNFGSREERWISSATLSTSQGARHEPLPELPDFSSSRLTPEPKHPSPALLLHSPSGASPRSVHSTDSPNSPLTPLQFIRKAEGSPKQPTTPTPHRLSKSTTTRTPARVVSSSSTTP
ncbi:hypothetical protein FRC17_002334, partial [Serendipita sp. 399]